jgi:hypothetical protein
MATQITPCADLGIIVGVIMSEDQNPQITLLYDLVHVVVSWSPAYRPHPLTSTLHALQTRTDSVRVAFVLSRTLVAPGKLH